MAGSKSQNGPARKRLTIHEITRYRLHCGNASRGCTARYERTTTSTAFPNFRSYGSCSGIDLIVPAVDDRVAVEIMDELHDALFQLVFRADADVTEHGAGGFGEEPLDEIEPGAVLGGEHEPKASFRSRRQPSLGLLRDVRGVIIEDD